MQLRHSIFLLVMACSVLVAQGQGGGMNLRCQNAVNPRGLKTRQPEFTWVLHPNAKQRAYQIVVASSEAKLKANDPDLWDSGRVVSDQKSARYKGKPLQSLQRCYWKLRVWETFYLSGSWTEPQTFETGILPEP